MAGWILQGNPEYFDINRYLSNTDRIRWVVTWRQSEIKAGDVAFIWRSEGSQPGTGGIVAKAVVTGPAAYEEADGEEDLWNDSDKAGAEWRVPLTVLEVRLSDGMIPRAWLLADPQLSDLTILRLRNRSNYLLPNQHLTLLEELWGAADDDEILGLRDVDFPEGRLKLANHLRRERNRTLVEQAKAYWKTQQNNELRCSVCSFSFRQRYGDLGEGYIEMHHIVPLSELTALTGTRIMDLVPVCANCHRMLHRKRPWPTVEELKALVEGSNSRSR